MDGLAPISLKPSVSVVTGALVTGLHQKSRNFTNCIDHDTHYLEPKKNKCINAVEKNMLCIAINELLNLLSITSVIFLV